MVLHEKHQDGLFDTLNINCNAVQDQALQILMTCEIPVITAFSALSKGDCMHALRKHTSKFNKLEEAVFLSTMTDYVSCASQNCELFDVFHKGNKYYSLSTLLMTLGSKWLKFFVQLKASDLTCVQLRSLVSLLKRSVDRLTDKSFLKEALVAGENKLGMFQSTSDFLSSTSISLPQQLESERDSNSLASGGGIVKKPKAKRITKSQNILNIPSAPLKSIQKVKIKNTTLSAKLPTKRKYGADIAKYTLKASENRVMHDKLETENRKIKTTDIDAEISGSQKSQNLNTSAHQAGSLDSPSIKKKKLELPPTGKINAFAILMKKSKPPKKNQCSKKLKKCKLLS